MRQRHLLCLKVPGADCSLSWSVRFSRVLLHHATCSRCIFAERLGESLPAYARRTRRFDEWAWKKGRTSGTILVDLERKFPVNLLPDRDADSVATWLKLHPGVEIIVGDRSGLFADGALRGAPLATPVVDRYHLVKKLVEALARFFLHK